MITYILIFIAGCVFAIVALFLMSIWIEHKAKDEYDPEDFQKYDAGKEDEQL